MVDPCQDVRLWPALVVSTTIFQDFRVHRGGDGARLGQATERKSFMKDTVRLGRIIGVNVGLHWSLLIIAALLAAGLGASTLPAEAPSYGAWAYGLAGVLTALGFLAAVLVHELGHAVVARREGLPVEGITLWLLGGVTRLGGEAPTPAAELRITGVGPLMSLVLGLFFAGLGWALHAAGWSQLVSAALGWLGAINVVLAIFNVLPGAPLDGGRLLHAVLWRHHGDRLRATETATRAGWVLGLTLVGLGFVGFALAGVGGLWLALLGWFLMAASRAEEVQAQLRHSLGGLQVADLMTPDPVHGPGWVTVQAFIDDYVLTHQHSAFPIDAWEGGLTGLVTLNQLRAVPRDQRSLRRASDVAWPLAQVATVRPDQAALEAVVLMSTSGAGRALVVDGDRLVGIISPSDVSRALQRSALHAGAREGPHHHLTPPGRQGDR